MTQFAPFAMLRVAGAPYERLLRMAPPRTGAHISGTLMVRAAMMRVQPAVEDLLYAAIPRMTEPALRRDALTLRRDVHNGRTPDARLVERIQDLLTAPERDVLGEWLSAQSQFSSRLQAAEDALEEEIETHVRGGLRRFVDDELFLRALALASPDLWRSLQAEATLPPRGRDPSPTERSLLRYALRAAAKTSPFSSFLHQGPVEVRPGDASVTCDLEQVTRSSRSSLNRGLLARICRAALLRHADGSRPLFRVNSTARISGVDRIEALAGEYMIIEKRTWRTESVASFQCPSGLATVLAERASSCVSRDELIAWIVGAGIERGRAPAFLWKLVERGIVREAPWTDALDAHPENGVVAVVESEDIAQAVARMSEIATGFAETDGRTRAAVLSHFDAVAARAWTAAAVDPDVRRDNAILEDGHLDGVRGAFGEALCEPLRELAEWIRARAEVAPEYVAMREKFLRTFGRGGRCTDVTRFLVDVLRQPATSVPAQSTSESRIAVTVFVQIAAPGLVVNHVLDGIGWIAARHTRGNLDAHARLGSWLRTWLVDAMAPREAIDILGRGECNNLQEHERVTRRVLSWPSEPIRCGTEGVVALDRCSLVHDLATDDLELRDYDDVPLAPVYLGGTIAGGFELMNLLRLLAQPHRVSWPPQEPPPDEHAPVVHRPRLTSGAVVIRRAEWWIRSRHLRSAWFSHRHARRLLDVVTDRDRHDIPEVFFAQLRMPTEPDRFAAVSPRHRKPLWVDSRNPFCLELLERLALHGKWVILRELLPDSSGLWTEIEGQRYVSELHCEMMLHRGRVRSSVG